MAGNAHHAIDKMGYKLIGMIRRRNGVGSPLSLSGLALAPGLSSEDAKTLLLGSLRGSGPLGRRVWLTAWMHWILGLQPRLSAGSGKGEGETLPAWEKNPVTPQLPAGWRKGQSLLAPAQPHPALPGRGRGYLEHGLWLGALLRHVHAGPAAPLVVPDALGHLCGLQPLEAVAAGATPLVDVL